MSTDYRYFPTLAIPGGTMGQVLTKSSNDPDNGAQWLDPSTGIGPTGPAGPAGPVGPPGAAGTPGATGPAGADGTIWLTGSGVPAGGLGAIGNYYLNSINGDVYVKTGASTWAERTGWRGLGDQYGASITDGFNPSGCFSTPSFSAPAPFSMPSGTLIWSWFRAPTNFSPFRGWIYVTTAHTGATATTMRIGLYSAPSNMGLLTLLASTANDVTLCDVAGTSNRLWTVQPNVVQDSWYALAFVWAGAGTAPSVQTQSCYEPNNGFTSPLQFSGRLIGQANLPATIDASLSSSSANRLMGRIS